MSLARDQSLTIVVTGKPLSVMAARREVLNRLQTQVCTMQQLYVQGFLVFLEEFNSLE